jgi:hypothetical protein
MGRWSTKTVKRKKRVGQVHYQVSTTTDGAYGLEREKTECVGYHLPHTNHFHSEIRRFLVRAAVRDREAFQVTLALMV